MISIPTNPQNISFETYIQLVEEFAEKERAIQERNWIDSKISYFDEILRINYSKPLLEFSTVILSEMAETTQAFSGILYLYDESAQILDAIAGYSCKIELLQQRKFKPGEGLVGQSYQSLKMLSFQDLPIKNVSLKSASLVLNNANVLIVPLVFNKVCYGVFELVYVREVEKKYLEIIQKSSRSIAAILESIVSNHKTMLLLKETQEQAEMLKAQEEEMRQNVEELMSTQEELSKRSKMIEEQKLTLENTLIELEDRQKELERYQHKLENNEAVLKKSLEKAKLAELSLKQINQESIQNEQKLRNEIMLLLESNEKLEQELKKANQCKTEAMGQTQKLAEELKSREEEVNKLRKQIRQDKMNE